MLVLVNTDNHIEGSDALTEEVRGTVESAVAHLADQLTRVEVYLSDENGDKGGDRDIRCAMEARIEGHEPQAAIHQDASLDLALEGAAEKLARALESLFGRLDDRR